MIKAIIFDVGGVLIRTENRASRAELEERLGLEKGQADMLYFNGVMGRKAQVGEISTAELLKSIQAELHLDQAGIEAFRREFWAGDILDSALVNYIRSLRPLHRTAIISNWADNLLAMITDEYPMADAFELIVSSADEKVMKPDASIFNRTVNKLGIEPHEAIFIDDFAHNIDGARAAGLAAIHFIPGINLPAILAEHGVIAPAELDERFIFRAASTADIPQIVAVSNAHSMALIGEKSVMAVEMETEFKTPGFVPARDTIVAIERETGRYAAYIECWNETPPHVESYLYGRVHPDFQRLGIGKRLLQLIEGRSRSRIHLSPPDARIFTLIATNKEDKAACRLFEQSGYTHTRTFHKMMIDLVELPPAPAFPAGIIMRSYQPDDLEPLVHAVEEAFADHWGHVDSPFETALGRWRNYLDDPTFDPEMWLIAFDGAEIAGFSVCWKEAAESPAVGLVNDLGVRRPWRKRGLGLALLRQSFHTLYKKGKTKVKLGVDSGSLTNATALYERAGMRVVVETVLHEKELRPGIDLRSQ